MWLNQFRKCVDAHADRVAIVTAQEQLTYRELLARATERAAELLARDTSLFPRCLIVSRDPLTLVELVIGAWIGGLVPAVCHDSLPASALEAYRALFERLSSASGRRAPAVPGEGTAAEGTGEQPHPESEGLILTTSGSMGTPKLVVLPRRSVLWNVMANLALAQSLEEPNLLVAIPVSRGIGLNAGVLVGLAAGWTVHLFPEGTPPPILQTHIRTHGITLIRGTPSFFRLFFAYWNGRPFESLRQVTAGGEAFSAGLRGQLAAGFPNAEITATYGITEAGTRVAQVTVTVDSIRRGFVGKPLPEWNWKIEPVPEISQPAGELWLKGWTLFLGYLEEDGSYSGLDAEGYFHTGDLVAPDGEGGLLYKGRAGALVRIGGYFANPIEVEQVIRAMPGVQEARVFPNEHPLLGMVLDADVVLVPGAALDVKGIKRNCAVQLEPYKVPERVRLVDEVASPALGKVPRTPSPRG